MYVDSLSHRQAAAEHWPQQKCIYTLHHSCWVFCRPRIRLLERGLLQVHRAVTLLAFLLNKYPIGQRLSIHSSANQFSFVLGTQVCAKWSVVCTDWAAAGVENTQVLILQTQNQAWDTEELILHMNYHEHTVDSITDA